MNSKEIYVTMNEIVYEKYFKTSPIVGSKCVMFSNVRNNNVVFFGKVKGVLSNNKILLSIITYTKKHILPKYDHIATDIENLTFLN
jgi:hypothetical protein